MTFEFSSALPKGEVTLHVHYTGILNDQLKGFYRSKYFHPSHPEEERYMAVTQFEVRPLLYFLLLVPLLPSPLLPPSGHLSFVVSLVFRSRLPMATESESFHSSTTCRLCCDSSFQNA